MGWDGWTTSPTQWTWVWVNSGSRWWIRKPGVLQFTRLQRVRHNWAIELSWTDPSRNRWDLELYVLNNFTFKVWRTELLFLACIYSDEKSDPIWLTFLEVPYAKNFFIVFCWQTSSCWLLSLLGVTIMDLEKREKTNGYAQPTCWKPSSSWFALIKSAPVVYIVYKSV